MEVFYLDVIAIAQHIDLHDDLVSNDDTIHLFIVVVDFLLKRYSAEEQSRFLKIIKFCSEEVITNEVLNNAG